MSRRLGGFCCESITSSLRAIDIRTKQTANRDCLIKKLKLLGWTQQEIADTVGLTQQAVSKITTNGDFAKSCNQIRAFLKQGKDMTWITEHYSIDAKLAWALRLWGMTDDERAEAVRKTSHKDNVPLLLHEGYTFEEIAQLETQDNENDEYHEKVSVVDVWSEYARLRDEEGWTQEKIARAKGVSQAIVSYRLKLHDNLPNEIKGFITQGNLEETHCREISQLSLELYFSSWLTTESLWLDLAETAVEKSLSVKKLKEQHIDRWKKVIEKAEDPYNKLDEELTLNCNFLPAMTYNLTLCQILSKYQNMPNKKA